MILFVPDGETVSSYETATRGAVAARVLLAPMPLVEMARDLLLGECPQHDRDGFRLSVVEEPDRFEGD